MNFDLSHKDGEYDLANYYNHYYMQQAESGTFVTRLQDSLKYENTGNSGTVRVSARDLKELLARFEDLDNEARQRHIDLDLRSEPTIVNIPNSIEKEQYIKNNPQALF